MSTQAEYQANNYAATGSAADAPTTAANTGSSSSSHQSAPNVRHIPIFVEGRDEPLINRHHEPSHNSHPNNLNRSASSSTQHPSATSFDWSKKFPTMGGQQSGGHSQRSDSPHRTASAGHGSSSGNGVGAQHGNQNNQWQPQHQSHEYSQTDGSSARQPKTPQHPNPEHSQGEPGNHTNADFASITKIQKIQKDVLDLMDQVERFTGNTRKDRQYLYLDEMLTQNLLKLDTIDTDGKDNIKQARREAIKCIHKCISVLEAKADSGNQQAQQQRNSATAV